MKWLSAGLISFNATTVLALLLGMIANGLSKPVAIISLIGGLIIGAIAYYFTDAVPLRTRRPKRVAETTTAKSKRQQRREQRMQQGLPPENFIWRYRSLWFWVLAACFAIFAFRSFCWLIYWDGNEVKVQSPNNLGDLSLHLTYINHFASGVPLWPDNPIEPFSKLRYPAGVDLFNAVLTTIGVNLIRGLVWTGLIASLATFYAFYRWAGNFGVAAFLFNGGLASFPIVFSGRFLDYQGANNIAWKSLALSMFVTQRGVLYAFPAALLLLYQWRARFFPEYNEPARVSALDEPASEVLSPRRAPLPFWAELSLYATMPLYHSHTFICLSVILAFLFILGDRAIRIHCLALVGAAILPATFCVWVTTDYFHAGSFIKWQPGWVQNTGDMKMAVPTFWLVNFGAWVPLVLFFIGITGWTVWKQKESEGFKISATIAFLIPALAIFLVGNLVKLAPWEWDNIKVIVWAYFLILPFLWTDLLSKWPVSLRAVVYIALFVSGFVTLWGGLSAGRPTPSGPDGVGIRDYGIADRGELDAIGGVVKKLPAQARYAGWPTWGHPILLQGRGMVLGYPGHLWTQGFDYGPTEAKLKDLMLGTPNWQQLARELNSRFLFWGREEKSNYAASRRPWEREAALVATGDWGSIYDLAAPPNSRPVATPLLPKRQ
jgi:hypothetical protein